MTAVRALAVAAALAFFFLAARAYERRRLSVIIVTAVAGAVAVLSISPALFDPIFSWFNVQPGNERRLIFLLVVAFFVLLFLVLRLQSESDTNERSLRLLVEALG